MSLKSMLVIPFLLLAGCATVPSTPVVPVSFQETAVKVCNVVSPVADGVKQSMSQLVTPLDSTDSDNIIKAVAYVDIFCMQTDKAAPVDVQNLVDQVFPILVGVVQNSTLSANGKNLAIISLGAAQTGVRILVPSVKPASVPVTSGKPAAK